MARQNIGVSDGYVGRSIILPRPFLLLFCGNDKKVKEGRVKPKPQ